MSRQLTQHDLSRIQDLLRARVLESIDASLLDQEKGIILVACSDGDRFFDMISHHANTQLSCRPTPRMHTFGWHGGAIACAPRSPVNKRRRRADRIYMDMITEARNMKGMELVGLYSHVPCGAAYACGLPVEEVLALTMRARSRVKTMNHGIRTVCLFHVDYGAGKMKTYFVNGALWERWAKLHGKRAIA